MFVFIMLLTNDINIWPLDKKKYVQMSEGKNV